MSTELRDVTLGDRLGGFAVLALQTARVRLTYRMSTLFALLASALAYTVVILVWLEVYRENPEPGPLALPALLAYLVTAFVANEVLTLAVEWRVFQRVRMGLIATDVIRPIGFVWFQMAQAAGDVLVNLVFALPIVVAGFWFVGAALVPPSAASALLGAASAVLAFFVSFGLSFLIVQAAFVLLSGYGVLTAREALQHVFSGLAAPLVMFPEGLRNVAVWLPFRHVVETPVTIWLGQAPASAVPALLAGQAAWGFALIAAGSLIFGAVLKRHQVQGG